MATHNPPNLLNQWTLAALLPVLFQSTLVTPQHSPHLKSTAPLPSAARSCPLTLGGRLRPRLQMILPVHLNLHLRSHHLLPATFQSTLAGLLRPDPLLTLAALLRARLPLTLAALLRARLPLTLVAFLRPPLLLTLAALLQPRLLTSAAPLRPHMKSFLGHHGRPLPPYKVIDPFAASTHHLFFP